MFGKKRIYDIIASVMATLFAALVVNNFKFVLVLINFSFQTKLSVAFLTISSLSFFSIVITKTLLGKKQLRELNEKEKKLADMQLQKTNEIDELKTRMQKEIDHLKLELTRQEELSSIDKLTDAYNTNQVPRILQERIERSKEKQLPFVGLLIDVDNFKRINDTYGHEAGNLVLRQVAFILKPRSADDVLIRYGGDEFLIFSKIGDVGLNGHGLGSRLKKEISAYEFIVDYKNEKIESLTISCGVTQFRINDSQEQFLQRLSTALNIAKKNDDGTDKKNFVALIE